MYKKSSKHLLALNTFIKLMRCTNSISNHVHNHFLDRLTVSQFGILEALYHLGPMSQKELAAKILKSPGNITTIINNLVKNEFVSRRISPEDKRFYSIELTAGGRQLIEEIFPYHADVIKERFSILSESEQRTLGKLLKKLSTGYPEKEEHIE